MASVPESGQVALIAGVERLRQAGVEGPAQDARLLLAEALGVEPTRLSMVVRDPITAEAAVRFEALIAAREARQPMAQILGRRWFYGRLFRVTRDTLDPRPETELLIERALSEPFTRVLDLGTGTGAIALTLLAERGDALGVASDLSPKALAVARENAVNLGVAERLQTFEGSWFEPISGRFDLIVSNPPYITDAEMAELSPEVRGFEPHMALTPGGDGLGPYRVIAAEAGGYLTQGGRLLVEIGYRQGADVAGLFEVAGLTDVTIWRDWNGLDRVVSARKA